MTVDVDIVTKEARHAIVVSADAIRHGPDGKPFVFVVRDGKAYKTPVVAGASNDTSTVVRQGLRTGDRIVADTNPAVADGSAVKPAPSPSPQATATPR